MSMNVLETLISAISMQLAIILKGVTPAIARVDTQEMGYFAQVSASSFQLEYIALSQSTYYNCLTALCPLFSILFFFIPFT